MAKVWLCDKNNSNGWIEGVTFCKFWNIIYAASAEENIWHINKLAYNSLHYGLQFDNQQYWLEKVHIFIMVISRT